MNDRHSQKASPHSDAALSQSPDQFDPLVVAWVRQYQEDLEAGRQPDRQAALTLFPEIKEELSACLDALEMVHHAMADLTGGDGGQTATAQQDALPPQARLGNFRLLREVGRGGMGVVYEAEDLSLSRRVALKVLPFAAMLDQRQLHRFKNEARTVATLHHTNIVPVFSVGCENGVHYYAMQFVQGRSLAQVLAELRRTERAGHEEGGESSDLAGSLTSEFVKRQSAPFGAPPADDASEETSGHASDANGAETTSQAAASADTQVDAQAMIATAAGTHTPAYFRSVANLGAQAADALEHAHYNGVIHRDIKPANLLLDESGHLWVTDFGLARLEGEAAVSLTGDVLGTLRYMSPEQALGKRTAINSQSDIYSLGATLYELLTLQPLATGRDREQIFRQIVFEQPRALRELNKSIPRDLETIVLKAVEKEPVDRYETAQQLGDDLRRFLDDKPIQARRPTMLQKTVKWSRRHRGGVAVAIATAFSVVLAGAVLMWHGQRREAEQRVRAEENLRLALDAVDQIYIEYAEENLSDWMVSARPGEEKQIPPEAEKFLRKALTFYEQFSEANHDAIAVRYETATAFGRIGNIRSQLGMHDMAEKAFVEGLDLGEELVRQFPAMPKYRQCLAQIHALHGFALGRRHVRSLLRKVIVETNEAIRLDPDNALAYNVRGMAFVETQHFKQAVADFGQAIRLDSDDTSSHYTNRGFAYAKMRDLEKAIADYNEALRLDPESYVAYSNRGVTYTNKGNYAHALTDLNEAIRLNPNRVVAYGHRATVYMMKRDYAHAVADLSEEVRLEPNRALHYNNRGLAYKYQGDLDRAMADFNQCLRLDPDFFVAYSNRGSLYVKKGDFTRALSDFNEAIRRAPENAGAYCSRGEMYMEQGRFDEGNADLAQAVDLKPEWASIYYKQALALLATGQVDGYRASCAHMLEQFAASQDVDDQFFAAWTCALAPHAVDDLPAAIAFATNTVGTDPESTRNLVTIGALLYRAGRVEEAIARLTEADRLAPTSDPPPKYPPSYTWYFLAMAQHAAGHTDQAKGWLAKAVESTDKTLSDAQQDAGSKITWNQRLTLNLLRAEAEALLSASPK